jgi:predicted DNA-binding helix-hairpin-helix protein
MKNKHLFPVDVNLASREKLLRVPGLGVKTVERILETRIHRKLKMEDLGKLHVPMNRVKYFVTALDSNPSAKILDSARFDSLIFSPEPMQLDLFSVAKSVLSGEL